SLSAPGIAARPSTSYTLSLHDALPIFRGQIHDGEILVIEFAVLVDHVAVALHQIVEQGLVRVGMAIEVHGDEARELQKARIDVTDRKSTRLNSSHQIISYAVFCWKNNS